MRRAVAISYLAGVVVGDGWLTDIELGLRVKDQDFAQAFVHAIADAFDVVVSRRLERRAAGSYWVVRCGNRTGRFSELRDFIPKTHEQRAAWLRGLFDSEGNAQLSLHKHVGPASFGRRVAMYSTNIDTLRAASGRLAHLGLNSYIRATKNSATHKGTKTVFELCLRGSKENYALFTTVVGSSIERKRKCLAAIVASYKPDLSAHCREIQGRGAATKTARTKTVTIPRVVASIRKLATAGKTTYRQCADIPGYWAARRHHSHRELVAMAIGES